MNILQGQLGSGCRTGRFGRGGSALCYCPLGLQHFYATVSHYSKHTELGTSRLVHDWRQRTEQNFYRQSALSSMQSLIQLFVGQRTNRYWTRPVTNWTEMSIYFPSGKQASILSFSHSHSAIRMMLTKLFYLLTMASYENTHDMQDRYSMVPMPSLWLQHLHMFPKRFR